MCLGYLSYCRPMQVQQHTLYTVCMCRYAAVWHTMSWYCVVHLYAIMGKLTLHRNAVVKDAMQKCTVRTVP